MKDKFITLLDEVSKKSDKVLFENFRKFVVQNFKGSDIVQITSSMRKSLAVSKIENSGDEVNLTAADFEKKTVTQTIKIVAEDNKEVNVGHPLKAILELTNVELKKKFQDEDGKPNIEMACDFMNDFRKKNKEKALEFKSFTKDFFDTFRATLSIAYASK